MGKRSIYYLKNIINEILNVIFPPEDKCIVCGSDYYTGICINCYNKIKRVCEIDNYVSFGYYGGSLKKLILDFKYKNNYLAGEVISELLVDLIKTKKIKFDIITFIPLTKKKERIRGFNQSLFIAKYLSMKLEKPYLELLIKERENKEQKTLEKHERRKNVENIYKLKYRNKNSIEDKIILLIDDVITTGYTIDKCEEILIENKAKNIVKISVARAVV